MKSQLSKNNKLLLDSLGNLLSVCSKIQELPGKLSIMNESAIKINAEIQ